MMGGSSKIPSGEQLSLFGSQPGTSPNECFGEPASRHTVAPREQAAKRPDDAWDCRRSRSSRLYGVGGDGRPGGSFGEDPHAWGQSPAGHAWSTELRRG